MCGTVKKHNFSRGCCNAHIYANANPYAHKCYGNDQTYKCDCECKDSKCDNIRKSYEMQKELLKIFVTYIDHVVNQLATLPSCIDAAVIMELNNELANLVVSHRDILISLSSTAQDYATCGDPSG